MLKANKFLAIIVLAFFVVSMGSCGGGGGGERIPVTTPQATVSSFIDAAVAQDVEKMAENFHPDVKEAYRTDFNLYKQNGLLPELAEILKTSAEVYVEEDFAKYEVQVKENGEVITFYIYLVKDESGSWKIYSL
jgi:hypothetical protein